MSQSYLRLKMFIKINKIILHVSKSFKTITTKLYINTCIKYIVIFMKMLYESKLLRIQMLIKINQPIKFKKKDLKINAVLQMLFLWLLDKHFRAISKASRSVFRQYIFRGKPASWARVTCLSNTSFFRTLSLVVCP